MAVRTPGRAGHRLLRALHRFRVLATNRVQQPKIQPPEPEAGIELHRLAGVVDRFIHQSDTGKQIRSHEPPHLAERILFDHARQLQPRLVDAADGEQKERGVPLTQVRRQRLARDGEPEAALRLAPVVVVVAGDDAEHGVGFGQIRVDLERALSPARAPAASPLPTAMPPTVASAKW